jgi:hypothetical protein
VTGDFPIGATCAHGRAVVETHRLGTPTSGLYAGRDVVDGTPLLLTTSLAQLRSHAELTADLGYAIAGITGLRHVGSLDGGPSPLDVMVEEAPRGFALDSAKCGAPTTCWRWPLRSVRSSTASTGGAGSSSSCSRR